MIVGCSATNGASVSYLLPKALRYHRSGGRKIVRARGHGGLEQRVSPGHDRTLCTHELTAAVVYTRQTQTTIRLGVESFHEAFLLTEVNLQLE